MAPSANTTTSSKRRPSGPAGWPLGRLRQRHDFLRVAAGHRWRAPGFILQGRQRNTDDSGGPDDSEGLIRIGFTCSRKIGNAVARNRARRRLVHAAQIVLPRHGTPGWDYVMIGVRNRTVTRTFALLTADLETAVRRLAGKEAQ